MRGKHNLDHATIWGGSVVKSEILGDFDQGSTFKTDRVHFLDKITHFQKIKITFWDFEVGLFWRSSAIFWDQGFSLSFFIKIKLKALFTFDFSRFILLKISINPSLFNASFSKIKIKLKKKPHPQPLSLHSPQPLPLY